MEQAFERRPWLLPLILAVLTIVLLRPVVLPLNAGDALDGADFRGEFYPLYGYIQQTVQSGQLPLWNPHIFIGHPVAGDPQAGLFYPATWLIILIGAQRGIGLMMAKHTWLAAWGMARLARNFGSTYVGALLAGVIYAMSGWMAARYYAGHYTIVLVAAWIPWAMLAYRYALSQRTLLATLPGMAVIGAAILAGSPPMVVYLVVCLIALWVYQVLQSDDTLREAWVAGRALVIMGIGGVILGAALLLPSLELTSLSSRSEADLAFSNTFALPPAQYISFALPGFFGSPKVGPYYYWGGDFYQEFMAYAGLFPLLAIPLALRWRRRESWFFIGLIALGLVLAIGLDGALLPLLVRWVPGFGMFRTPGRSLFFVMLGIAGLTAMLVTSLQQSDAETRREMLSPAVKLWIPLAALIAFVGAIFFAGWFASAAHNEPMPLRAFIISGSLASAGVILLGIWLALWLWSDLTPQSMRWALVLTVLIVVLDAWHVGIPIMTVSQISEEGVWSGARISVPTGQDARVVAPNVNENQASLTGHLNVAGYDPLVIDPLHKLQALSDINDPTTPINTLLGVKYFLTTKPYDKPNWELIGINNGGIFYRRKDAFPRAWFAQNPQVESNDDATRLHLISGKEDLQANVYLDRPLTCTSSGSGTATITDYKADSVEIKTSGGGGVLTLSDQYYPGWQATVDGQATDIVRADTVFRAVCVPAGDHVVRFDYRPNSLVIGMILSSIGWLLVLVATAITFRRNTP